MTYVEHMQLFSPSKSLFFTIVESNTVHTCVSFTSWCMHGVFYELPVWYVYMCCTTRFIFTFTHMKKSSPLYLIKSLHGQTTGPRTISINVVVLNNQNIKLVLLLKYIVTIVTASSFLSVSLNRSKS